MRHRFWPLSWLVVPGILLLAQPAPAGSPTRPAPAATDAATATVTVGEHVNINTADARALTRLSGIGPALAERIVRYREVHGPFKRPEELRNVEGVGGGLVERNRDRIVVE